jgi:ClpX C4-type zinc finger
MALPSTSPPWRIAVDPCDVRGLIAHAMAQSDSCASPSGPDVIVPCDLRCSFCGKRRNQVDRLVAGPGVHICGECVVRAVRELAKARSN